MDKKRNKRELIIRCICIILAFSLWLYVNNSGDVYKTSKINNVPVEIINEESLKAFGLAIVPDKRNLKVSLEVEGRPTDIYKAEVDDFKVAVDLSKYALKKGENKLLVDIVDYPSNLLIENNASLRVTIVVDNLVERNFDVSSDIKVQTKSGYYSGEPDVKTKSVAISGPAETVNKVNKVVAKGEVKDIEDDISQKFSLQALTVDDTVVQGIDISMEEIEVFIPVRKAKPVKINVKTTGSVAEDYILDYLTPENMYVELIGDDTEINKIKSIETTQVNLSDITGNTSVKAELIIPNGVEILNGKKTINVKVGVSKKATKEIMVKYSFKALSGDFTVESPQDLVKVVVKGSQDTLSKINKDNVKCEVNLAEYGEGEYEIEPKVILPNQDVELVSVEKVKVKLLKK